MIDGWTFGQVISIDTGRVINILNVSLGGAVGPLR